MAMSRKRLLDQLEKTRGLYRPHAEHRVEPILKRLRKFTPATAEELVRAHDAVLFLRAFPQSRRVAATADEWLKGIAGHVERLKKSGADFDVFDDERVSGVAGTTLRDTFTYEVARWLLSRHAERIHADWEPDEQARRLGAALPRFQPLIEDDCLVEADTPYLQWMSAASGQGREFAWLMRHFEEWPIPIPRKTELFDALGITLVWNLGDSSASRTLARRPTRSMFCHTEPLIQRKQVSLADELASPALPLRKLPPAEGAQILDMVREVLTTRYRELYGTTRGDAAHLYQADVGRGVQIFLWGLPPDRRLPLRAYHAGFTLKNGVPINYIEGISLFEWMEVGFNTFYAYRDGETAWIYGKVLRLLHQLTGVTCISVYPYQLGQDNEEAIVSGAFWFYRKLGFRPGRDDLLVLTEREERRMARQPSHRTSPGTLRKLAEGHVFYEFGSGPRGLWYSFSTRNLGLAVQRQMAREYGGWAERMREAVVSKLAAALLVRPGSLTETEQVAFTNFAFLLALVPDLSGWSPEQKQLLLEIIRAKANFEELDYLSRLRQHTALKQAVLLLGSVHRPQG